MVGLSKEQYPELSNALLGVGMATGGPQTVRGRHAVRVGCVDGLTQIVANVLLLPLAIVEGLPFEFPRREGLGLSVPKPENANASARQPRASVAAAAPFEVPRP